MVAARPATMTATAMAMPMVAEASSPVTEATDQVAVAGRVAMVAVAALVG